MPQDAPLNSGAPPVGPAGGPDRRVAKMQAKLHRWAVADAGRRFDDLFNLVHDPATLLVAWDRVAGNQGARTPGVDGRTVAHIEREVGVAAFLDGVRAQLKQRAWHPLPVRERKIPKPGGLGKVRGLGIPRVEDRLVQAALKLVLEPIFEAGFLPVSYGFRPMRRAQDAIAEIHLFGTHGYRWVLDADIEAAFDNVSHRAVMDAVRARVKDKRVLALVKAFLKAGILTEDGQHRDTHTGTPQGGILSPLIFNIALSVLDEHLHGPWKPNGQMGTAQQRARRRARSCRRGESSATRMTSSFSCTAPGPTSKPCAKTSPARSNPWAAPVTAQDPDRPYGRRVRLLGFHIRWRRKRGTRDTWHVYTFIADRPIRSLKAKVRALTHRTAVADPRDVLIRLNQIMRGWSNYFKHAVAKHTFRSLAHFAWRRVIRWLMTLHRWRWTDVRRWLVTPEGKWRRPHAGGIELLDLQTVAITRYCYRGTKIPNPWTGSNRT